MLFVPAELTPTIQALIPLLFFCFTALDKLHTVALWAMHCRNSRNSERWLFHVKRHWKTF
ncbi:hypothetical protein NRI_0464 [Neorickettsia risticii str. Illinois]|uniref:Uncharacterized protein n=1 Tax=Neorickettsia risticii (strain Illinois) TaxID=434131 RepID=C6V4X8_NEORI|nr:hypothetical protein NRI_0464 [Neorickettsia risticii str. Illinois]